METQQQTSRENITFVNFVEFKGDRKVFLNVREAINKDTGLVEQWQELCFGDSPESGEVVRISSKLATISGQFLKENFRQLQVATCPEWKYPRLCKQNALKCVSSEEIEL